MNNRLTNPVRIMNTADKLQEAHKENFRLRMDLEILKRRGRLPVDDAIVDRLLVTLLAKNKTLTALSKSELREEKFEW